MQCSCCYQHKVSAWYLFHTLQQQHSAYIHSYLWLVFLNLKNGFVFTSIPCYNGTSFPAESAPDPPPLINGSSPLPEDSPCPPEGEEMMSEWANQ